MYGWHKKHKKVREMLYEDVLSKWLQEKNMEVRNSTIQNYVKSIKNWIIPAFGDIEIKEISRKDLQDFVINFSKGHKRNTVINITKPLSGSLKWAEESGFISCSPWKHIKIPRDFSEKEINTFTEEEMTKILSLNTCKKNTKDIVLLAYRTGMRIGEILSLKWEDINFKEGFLTVQRTLSGYINGQPEITESKTKKSKRRIDLDKLTIQMLAEKYNKKEGYVFSKKDGSMYSRQAIKLPKICENVGIKPRSFHTLRHTHATILLAAGIHPKIVQARLGHSNISTTLDIYSHLVAGMQQAAVDVFNEIK